MSKAKRNDANREAIDPYALIEGYKMEIAQLTLERDEAKRIIESYGQWSEEEDMREDTLTKQLETLTAALKTAKEALKTCRQSQRPVPDGEIGWVNVTDQRYNELKVKQALAVLDKLEVKG